MLNKLQQRCWPDNAPFTIAEINFIGYFAHSPSENKKLEGMITIEYRHHTPLEQDLQVGLLLVMHIGNDIPTGEAGSGLKWCPIRNELAHTSCTVTRVSARRSTRGHCRQDIPLGIYDRKQQRWTLKDKTDEIAYLMTLTGKSDVTADPPISSNVSTAIPARRVGQFPEYHPGLALTHMVSAIRE
jgi:hypothetical protein